MHFALISTPTVTEFRSRAELLSAAVQDASREPQLGILNVAAVLEQWGDTPPIFDANAAYMRFALDAPGSGSEVPQSDIDGFAHHLAETAVRSNADVYGLSTICSTYPLTLRIAAAIKQLRPCSTILLGGPQASVVDVATLETFPHIDYILRGEVEQSLPIFLQQLTGNYDFARVPGLTYREGGFGPGPGPLRSTVRRTLNAPVIEDLDTIPSPAYHLSAHLDGATSAPIELGRGCPFACTFCSTNDFFRRRFRLRSPAKVLAEMRLLHARHGIRDFDLVHDMFTVDRKRVVAFCEAMAASGDNFTWRCSARTDCVDEALLEQMAGSGCRSVFFGIESGSTRIQRLIDKDLDPAYAQEMLAAAERHGMRSTASLITGFPQEEWQDVRDTLQIFMRAARCSRSHPQLNLLAPLANTPIYHAHKHEMELEELCSDMSHQGLNQSPQDLDLIRAFPEIFSNFYMVPAPALEREVLFELRQFLTVALELFRWPLCFIAQHTDLLDFHAGWRYFRQHQTGPLTGTALRLYYVGQRFRPHFLAFLHQLELPGKPALSALLQAEAATSSAATAASNPPPPGTIPPGDPLHLAHTITLHPATRLLTLPYDLDTLLHSIAAATEPLPQPPIHYATSADAHGTISLRRITPLLAAVLQQCEHSTTPAHIVDTLAPNLYPDDPAMGAFLATELLRGAHRDGWLRAHHRNTTLAHTITTAIPPPARHKTPGTPVSAYDISASPA